MARIRLSIAEQSSFFKRLSFLIGAHIPLLEALHILQSQSSTKTQVRIYQQLVEEVSEGRSLSKSLAKRSNSFGAFAISIIKVGEQSGTLSSNLVYLSEELHKRQALKRALVGSLVYPAIITMATLGITAFLLLFLFPKILPVFTGMHVALPLSTRIVLVVSTFVSSYGLAVFVVVVVIGIACLWAIKISRNVRYCKDWLLLSSPIVGTVLIAYSVSQFSRTLGLLLRAGIPLSEALYSTADATPNRVYQRYIFKLAQAVEKGTKISDFIAEHGTYFPPTVRHLLAVGERSGSMPDTLLYIAEAYDAEVVEFTKRLSVLVEPMLMIVMGLLVGFIAISIITPLYGITQNLHA